MEEKRVSTNRKKLAIVAFAPSTCHQAPYNNDEYDIWVLNHFYVVMNIENINNITALFEPHTREIVSNKDKYNGVDHLDWLQKCDKFPIVMMKDIDEKNWSDVPMAVSYPWKEVINFFKLNNRERTKPFTYFTNTVSFMLGHAIYGKAAGLNQYETIEIYGVDMALASEYAYERPSCEYFVGVAWGMGIEIYLPENSDLLKTARVYGREELVGENKFMKDKQRITELKNRIATLKDKEIASIEEYYQAREAELLKYHTKTLEIAQHRSKLEGALENQSYDMEAWNV